MEEWKGSFTFYTDSQLLKTEMEGDLIVF